MAVEIEGARRLRSTLRKAGASLSDLKAPNRAAATIVAGHAQSVVPRKTGRLAGTIRPAATQRAGIVRAGYKRVPYAGPVHWGWPKRRIKAQPFLARTAKVTEPIWVKEYELVMRASILQVKGK